MWPAARGAKRTVAALSLVGAFGGACKGHPEPVQGRDASGGRPLQRSAGPSARRPREGRYGAPSRRRDPAPAATGLRGGRRSDHQPLSPSVSAPLRLTNLAVGTLGDKIAMTTRRLVRRSLTAPRRARSGPSSGTGGISSATAWPPRCRMATAGSRQQQSHSARRGLVVETALTTGVSSLGALVLVLVMELSRHGFVGHPVGHLAPVILLVHRPPSL